MKDRDALISSLATIARRRRLNAVLPQFAWAVGAISGALLVYQILAAAIAAPAAMSALKALLILLLIGIVGFFTFRAARPTTLEQAAATADDDADLKDELKSAYWFALQREAFPQGDVVPQGDAAPRGDAASLIDLQIHRAVSTVQRLNPGELLAITFPRGAFAAIGLTLVAGLLAWFEPGFARAPTPRIESIAAAATIASNEARKPQSKVNLLTPVSREKLDALDASQKQSARAADVSWAKLEATVHGLASDAALKDMAVAIKSRDAVRAAQLLEELARKHEFARAQSGDRSAANSSRASPDLLARLQELFSPGGNVAESALSGDNADELEKALSIAQKLDDKMRASGVNNPAKHEIDEGNNPLQAAIPLERYGPREARRSEGQGGEFEGTTDVEGGAMGRRVTQSNIGAGGKPSDNETSHSNKLEADPVLGKRTMRLAAQLEKLKIEGNQSKGEDSQGVAEGVYAATRAQHSQIDYQNMPPRSRYVSENAMSGERVPLAYRSAVKDYFLKLNQNEQ